MSLYDPLGFKPAYYWDETAGLKEEKPMLVKLVQSAHQRQFMPSKCPSAFGVTLGYTIPFQGQSHYVLWRVLPAGIELRQNQLIFTPATKEGALKAVLPEQVEEESLPPEEPEQVKPKPKAPEEKESLPEKNEPSFVVKYLPLPFSGKAPAVPVGVMFRTQRENHRVVWNVLPSGETLAKGLLILNPWESPEAAEASKSHWWQRR